MYAGGGVMADFLTIGQLGDDDLSTIYDRALTVPAGDELRGVGVALVFEFPSLRTRASSVAAVQRLGGRLSMFSGDEVGLDSRECAEDVARTLLQTSSIAALRVKDHGVFERMHAATNGELRLINLLSRYSHPTQAVADVLALADRFAEGVVSGLRGLTVAYVGDANNMTRSLATALLRLGVSMRVAAPTEYQFDQSEVDRLSSFARDGATLVVTDDPRAAAEGVQAIYTDTWVSMGSEDEAHERRSTLEPFRVDAAVMSLAASDAVFMHCLPAHRGDEVTDDVIDSPASLVWEQVKHRTSSMIGVLRWMKDGVL